MRRFNLSVDLSHFIALSCFGLRPISVGLNLNL
jgi:hypothetical protein